MRRNVVTGAAAVPLILALASGLDAPWAFAQPEPSPASAPAFDPQAVHADLRALRDAMMDAWGRRDIDGLLRYVDPDVVVTWQNGEVNRGPGAVRAFYQAVVGSPDAPIASINSKLEVSDLSILHGADTAVAFGTIHDEITFKGPVAAAAFIRAGTALALDSRWTATVVRKEGAWKVAAYHVSGNLFSNPLLALATRGAATIAAVLGLVIGLIVALLGAWLLGRRKRATA